MRARAHDDARLSPGGTQNRYHDAPFPTTGRWSVTYWASDYWDGIEQTVVTTPDATPPFVCGDGVVQAGEQYDDGNLIPADGCSPACKMDETDASLELITDHLGPSPPACRRLNDKLSSLSSRLSVANTCLSTSKDTDGDGTADCLDQCPYTLGPVNGLCRDFTTNSPRDATRGSFSLVRTASPEPLLVCSV